MVADLLDAPLALILGNLLPRDLARAACSCNTVRRACADPNVWAASSAASFDRDEPLPEHVVTAVVQRAGAALRKLNSDCPAPPEFLETVPRELEAFGYDSFGYSESIGELEEVLAKFPHLRDVHATVYPHDPPSAVVADRKVRGLHVCFFVDDLTADNAKWLSLENAAVEFQAYDETTRLGAVTPEFARALKETKTLKSVHIHDAFGCEFGDIATALGAVLSIEHLTIRTTSWAPSFDRLLSCANVAASTVILEGNIDDEQRLNALCKAFQGPSHLRDVVSMAAESLNQRAADRLRSAVPPHVDLFFNDDAEAEDAEMDDVIIEAPRGP